MGGRILNVVALLLRVKYRAWKLRSRFSCCSNHKCSEKLSQTVAKNSVELMLNLVCG